MLKAAHLSAASAQTTPESSSESSSHLMMRTHRLLMNDGVSVLWEPFSKQTENRKTNGRMDNPGATLQQRW